MIKMAEPTIKDEEINAVIDVLKSGHIARGEKVDLFERRFTERMSVEHAIATNSGTAALHAALYACDVCLGDEVIVPAFSFFSSASMINACGATPIFIDVEYDGCIDVDLIEPNITERTTAIVAVNLFGKVIPRIREIEDIAADYNISLIVDSCQCPTFSGAEYGDVSCFSFYATKNITTAEGGMITTNNESMSEVMEAFINHGQSLKYVHTDFGFNYRMTDIAASIGIEQLKRLESINKRRFEIAKLYDQSINIFSSVIKPGIPVDEEINIFHQYVIRCPYRTQLIQHLYTNNIETAIHYPMPIPRQPVYRKYYNRFEYPVAEQLSETVLSLPCHPNLLDEDVKFVADKINEFYEAKE